MSIIIGPLVSNLEPGQSKRNFIRERVASNLGDHWKITTSAAGAVDGSTIVADEFQNYADRNFNNAWALVNDDPLDGEEQRISTISGNTATMRNNFAHIVHGKASVELHRIPAKWYNESINAAIVQLFPKLRRRISLRVSINNLLRNHNFEFFDKNNLPFDWQVIGKASKYSTGKAGEYAVQINRSSEIVQVLPQDLLEGKSITATVYVKTAFASNARIALTDASGTTYSNYHTGGDAWEQLTVTRTMSDPAGGYRLKVITEASGLALADFAECNWHVDIAKCYLSLSDAFIGKQFSLEPLDEVPETWLPNWKVINHSGVNLVQFNSALGNDQNLHLTGDTYLSYMSSDDDIVEVGEQSRQLELLAVRSAYIVAARAAGSDWLGDSTRWRSKMQEMAGLESPLMALWPELAKTVKLNQLIGAYGSF